MSLHQDCETCGAPAHLTGAMCAECQRRFGFTTDFVNRERMLAVLSRHIGAVRGLTISQLVDEMASPRAVPADQRSSVERNARELVVELRLAGHHVCSHPSTGYYIAADASELDATCMFLFDRAMTSLSQVAAMRRVALPDLRGQLRLDT